MTTVIKITHGYVAQTFQDGKLTSQYFVAGDPVDFEDSEGNPVLGAETDTLYHVFDMKQPEEYDEE